MLGASPEVEVLADEGSAGCIASAGASELRQRRGAKGETHETEKSQEAASFDGDESTAAEQKQFREGAKVAAAFQARQFPPLPGTESVELPRGDFFLVCGEATKPVASFLLFVTSCLFKGILHDPSVMRLPLLTAFL
ncbi:hypothetical protein TGPRC2_309610 [Toxoplasma gondii TgCatPRC2]|uniref:Uncharacterized protein n=1 Tax=Toxoplasma gondii TgCatPRC2 TaxID=1130821 RepID=A0A151HL82_TOXGO|nr:hypothetical protein TGPRC2_309610 [Toxoplasma gondii TgCatPRC2]